MKLNGPHLNKREHKKKNIPEVKKFRQNLRYAYWTWRDGIKQNLRGRGKGLPSEYRIEEKIKFF